LKRSRDLLLKFWDTLHISGVWNSWSYKL